MGSPGRETVVRVEVGDSSVGERGAGLLHPWNFLCGRTPGARSLERLPHRPLLVALSSEQSACQRGVCRDRTLKLKAAVGGDRR